MSINQFNNKIVSFGQSVINYPSGITLQGQGIYFPNSNANNNAYFQLSFKESTQVIINYGNGVVITYGTTQISSTLHTFYIFSKGENSLGTHPVYGIPKYAFPDGLENASRIINIQYRRDLLTRFIMAANSFLTIQDLAFEFAKHPALEIFQIALANVIRNLNLTSVNAQYNSKLINVGINSSFSSTSPYYRKIPIEIFSLPLTSLSVGTGVFDSISFADSNLDKIALLKDTLINLSLGETRLSDNVMGEGPLPPNFSELKITSLQCPNTRHTVIPAVVNSITTLRTLQYAYSSYLVEIGDISALTQLRTLSHINAYSITTEIPAYYASTMINLVTWNYSGCFRTSERMTSFIGNVYTFIINNAQMTGSGTLPLRALSIYVGETTAGDGTVVPDGIFQQPSGYISGVSNGTPTTSLEKIWVLRNQYLHTWTYRAI